MDPISRAPRSYVQKENLMGNKGTGGKGCETGLNTDNKVRGRYAQMAVYVNMEKPLISKENCRRLEEASTDLARMNTAPEKGSVVFVTAAETRGFGSWMLVECDIESGVKENMQYGNFDGVKVHFNSAFEGPEGVEVSMTDGVLDPEKHSAVIFKENLHSNQ
ncbi:hypothetical protein PVK06_043362 [Gossypium arboreum]|uniref:Uncharacterized protein n=1 Tax=Gossypium arboreum TaxID=29729 RepID=A0ABR0MNA9_GOSAR|nr:hypothetical protein PVK06_043362 [Gossypium arboreum]